jgi:hypothetical protein
MLLNNGTVMLKEGSFQMLLLAVQDIGKKLVLRGSYRKLTKTYRVKGENGKQAAIIGRIQAPKTYAAVTANI